MPSGGTLPDWCQAWFSPHALYTRVGIDQLADARQAYLTFPRAFVSLARAAQPRPESHSLIEAAHDRYAAAHRTDDKGLRLLAKMFGANWSANYISDVLFPSRTSTAC